MALRPQLTAFSWRLSILFVVATTMQQPAQKMQMHDAAGPPLDDPEMVVALENVLDGQFKLHRAVPRHDAYVVEDPTLITVHLLLARL